MTNLKKLAEVARSQGLEPLLHENHKRPLTRRDLIAQGFLAGTGYVVTPALLSMMSQQAQAASCGADPLTATAPVNGMRILAFEAAGGMNIAGSNFMVWGRGGKGDYLPASALGVLGLPATMADVSQVNEEFGIPMHSRSPLLEGLLAATTPDCRAKISGFPICVTSMDDSSANPFSLAYYAYKAGALGSLANVVGTESSAHGARSLAPPESLMSSVSSTQIRSYEDARNLVTAANLEAQLPGRVSTILKAAGKLSNARLKMLSDKELPAQMRDLVSCGYSKSEVAAQGNLAGAVDGSKDTALLAALAGVTYTNTRNFTVTRDFANNGTNQTTLALSYLLCKGYAGFATQIMGGRDYHNNPRATTNQRDFEVGFQMGTAFQVAHQTGKSLVEILYTDGGVGCSDPNTPDDANLNSPAGGQGMFTSDRGEGGTIVVMAYHPAGRPPIINSRQQVNAFNNNGGVDQNYAEGKVVANSVTNAVQCALLNVMALHGKLGESEKVLGASHPFREASVQEHYVMFGPWPS